MYNSIIKKVVLVTPLILYKNNQLQTSDELAVLSGTSYDRTVFFCLAEILEVLARIYTGFCENS